VRRGEAEPTGDRVPGYSVDAGTGCFVDAATAAVWTAAETAWDAENTARVIASGVDPNDAVAWHAAIRERDAERPDLLARLRAAGYQPRAYAALAIDGANRGTLIAFKSGAGDGTYPSYWGFDRDDRAVILLTDFKLLQRPEEDEVSEADEDPPLVRLANAVIDRMLRDESLVLERRANRESLRDDLAEVITGFDGAALGEWLAEHAAVEEVFATDEDLDRVLADAATAERSRKLES
jgi:hypothetical protein